MIEAPQPNNPDQNATALQRQPEKEFSLDVRPPRRWPAVVFGGCLLVGAIGGVCAIVWASSLFNEITAIATFITVSIVGLFTLLAIAAQVFVYWEQRNLMARQWNAMLGGIDRTDKVIQKMQEQLDAINKQEGHLSAQADAAKAQSDTMQGQLDLMKKQVETAGKQIDLMVLNECAYVRIGTVDIEWDGQAIGVEGTFINGGRTPAWNFRHNMRVVFLDKPEVADYQPEIQIDEAQPPTVIVANTPPKSFSANPVRLSNEQIAKISHNEVEVVFDGLCRYDDSLGGRVYYRFGYLITLSYPPKTTERYQNYYREQAKPN